MKASKQIFGMFSAVVLVAFFGTACAESFPEKTGYLIDSRGNVVKNAYGECWRTGYWTPAMAIEECDPDLGLKKMPTSAEPISSAPAPVIAPPPPTPVPAPAPAPAKPVVQVRFNAETLFDFDRTVVKPEGQKILDEKIVASMKIYPEVAMLIIVGHADRIGTEAYNQNLSERRANAVKAHLVKQGIPAERMKASGKGESDPDPEANTMQACKGLRGNRLIACLQPDRRVTVESQKRTPE